MRNLIKKLNFLLLFLTNIAFAQVGINTTSPHNSAMLDIQSTNKGFLIPRMTEAQRLAIPFPALGLLVYQTNNITGFFYYRGSQWILLGSDSSEFQRFGYNVRNTTFVSETNFIFGGYDLNEDTSVNDDDARMQFVKNKAAFRAGTTSNNFSFNENYVGNYSFSGGYNNFAKGTASVSFGYLCSALGDYTVAIGKEAFASEYGTYSVSIGLGTQTSFRGETALGNYNTILTSGGADFYPLDRIFSVGNGTSNANRSNALTILRNGNTGIGDITPKTKLDIDGNIAIRSSGTSINNFNYIDVEKSYIKFNGTGNIGHIPDGFQTGQLLIIEFENSCTFVDDIFNLKLNGDFNADVNDILQLIWNGNKWIEITRSTN